MHHHQLIEVLAVIDATFAPQRDPRSSSWVAASERRQEYHRIGLPLKRLRSSPDAMERKDTAANLAELQGARLIKLSAPRARTQAVKMTPAGDWYARSQCGLPTLLDAWPLLSQLANPPSRIAGTDFCPECVLVGIPITEWHQGDHLPKFAELQQQAAPLLIRGLAESNCDVARHVAYQITPAGVELLTKGEPRPPADLPGADEEMEALYWDTWAQARGELSKAEPVAANEIGQCPLSASMQLEQPA